MTIYKVTSAFVNNKGRIEMGSNIFGASDETEALDDAKLYFPKRYEGTNFIYGKPEKINDNDNDISVRGIVVDGNRNVISVGNGSTRMVQINEGNSTGAQIITGDDNVTFIGGLHYGLGDK